MNRIAAQHLPAAGPGNAASGGARRNEYRGDRQDHEHDPGHCQGAQQAADHDDKGGWFDQGLAMQQPRGWDSPYETQARLRIVSLERRVSGAHDRPLEIRNAANAAQMFRDPKVTLALEGGEQKSWRSARMPDSRIRQPWPRARTPSATTAGDFGPTASRQFQGNRRQLCRRVVAGV